MVLLQHDPFVLVSCSEHLQQNSQEVPVPSSAATTAQLHTMQSSSIAGGLNSYVKVPDDLRINCTMTHDYEAASYPHLFKVLTDARLKGHTVLERTAVLSHSAYSRLADSCLRVHLGLVRSEQENAVPQSV